MCAHARVYLVQRGLIVDLYVTPFAPVARVDAAPEGGQHGAHEDEEEGGPQEEECHHLHILPATTTHGG